MTEHQYQHQLSEQDAVNYQHLGRGWNFPPAFSANGKAVAMHTDVANIEKSIRLLYATKLGERAFWLDYGINLEQYCFAELSFELLEDIRQAIARAISTYEPRIALINVQVLPDEADQSQLLVDIDYEILANNSPGNLVLSFSLDAVGLNRF